MCNIKKCDVLVAGGGMAGVCAAISAARNGAKVILCQDRSVLGGNASSEVRMHICGADMSGGRGNKLSVEAREGGIIEEIRLENAVRNPQKSWSMMDLILYEKCIAEKNLTLMLDTAVVAAETDGRRIISVTALRESTEDKFIITASAYIDCTGDGRMAAEAGADFREGREAKHEFNEPYANDKADNKSLGMSLLFEAEDMGHPVPFVPPPWIRKFTEEDLKNRYHKPYNYGFWWVEWGGCLDTVKDTPEIRHELLRIMLGVWDHIKNGGDHGADNYALTWLGFLPAKRESRRFKGLYTLTSNDVMDAVHFDDVIAFGGWPLDTHPPEGIDALDENPCHQPPPPYLFSIPLRSCISADIDNLMFAGRNISATHQAFASTRVMATCGVVGQGVGISAAIAAKKEIAPSSLPENKELMEKIQDMLVADDCFLPGFNKVKDEITFTAEVRASSQTENGKAVNVLSPLTRSVHGEGGVHPRYKYPVSTNRWISKELPAWIELVWDKDIATNELRIIFDTGLHRVLTLSHDKSSRVFNEEIIWAAQPETVKDYKVSYWKDNDWVEIIDVKDNYQRLRIHRFPEIVTTKIRVDVSATNGDAGARICNIRIV